MKILITGATGFIGKHVIAHFCREQIDCIGLSRSEFKANTWWPALNKLSGQAFSTKQQACLTWLQCLDFNQIDWSVHLADIDVVIHLAATVHVMDPVKADQDASFWPCNVTATENLAKACVQSGVKQLIFASSIKVLGELTTTTAYCESTTPQPQDAYGRSKLAAESAIEQVFAATDTRYTIIRLPLVYGPGVGANFARLIQLAQSRIPLPLAKICNQRSMLAATNLSCLLQTCCLNVKAYDQVYMISDDEDVSVSQLILMMNPDKRLFYVPAAWLKLCAKLVNKSHMANRLLDSLQVDIQKCQQQLDWKPKHSVQSAVNDTVQYHVQAKRELSS